jgi:hypothetical protein
MMDKNAALCVFTVQIRRFFNQLSSFFLVARHCAATRPILDLRPALFFCFIFFIFGRYTQSLSADFERYSSTITRLVLELYSLRRPAICPPSFSFKFWRHSIHTQLILCARSTITRLVLELLFAAAYCLPPFFLKLWRHAIQCRMSRSLLLT